MSTTSAMEPHAATPLPAAPDRWLTRGLMLCCAAAVFLCTRSWTTVAFPRLWGPGGEMPAHQTSSGLVCILACVLTLVIVGLEDGLGKDARIRAALSTSTVVTTLLAAGTLTAELLNGPGYWRGVSLAHTGWFYATAILCAAAVALAMIQYLRARRGM